MTKSVNEEIVKEMANDFIKYEKLELESASSGNLNAAKEYLELKWFVYNKADDLGVRKELDDMISELETP